MNSKQMKAILFAPLRQVILFFGRLIFQLIELVEYRTQKTLKLKFSILGFVVSSAIVLSSSSCQKTTCYQPAIVDNVGPYVTDVSAEPNPTQNADSLKIMATLEDVDDYDDWGVGVAYAELFIDSITENGAGLPMNASDSLFGSACEEVELTIFIGDWPVGTKKIFVQGKDFNDNWGGPDSIEVDVTEIKEK